MDPEENGSESEMQSIVNHEAGSRTETTQSNTKKLTCCNRLSLMFKPIQLIETTYNGGDGETKIVIVPESFRMGFYFGFYIFCVIAYIVSSKWGGLDLENNPILNRFGANNVCVYFDNAPFSLFSSILWMPVLFCLLIYSLLDYFRVYDSYIDQEISKSFWRFYAICTFYEVFAVVFSIQFTATTPYESMYLHTIPYVTLTYAFFTLAFKKFLYFYKIGIFHNDEYHKCWYYLGWIYCVILLITVIIKSLVILPNLFGAELWKIEGLEWSQPFSAVNGHIHNLLVFLVPVFIYFIFTKDLKTITVTLNRTNSKK